MATKSEILRWINEAQNTVDRYKRTIEDCNRKIARLEPVYQELGNIKKEFKSAKKSTESIFEEKGNWRGEKQKSFYREGEILDDLSRDYYNKLDKAQDAVNTKIGELKAQKAKLFGIIGDLAGKIQQMWVAFQNALN